MDSLDTLVARYPGLRWARMRTHHAGRAGPLVVAVFSAGDGWCANGQLGPGRLVHHGEGADVHAALRSLAQCSPAYAEALREGPTVDLDVPDDPMSGPAALGCPALAATVGLAGVGGLLLWLGWLGVWWLTGGAS